MTNILLSLLQAYPAEPGRGYFPGAFFFPMPWHPASAPYLYATVLFIEHLRGWNWLLYVPVLNEFIPPNSKDLTGVDLFVPQGHLDEKGLRFSLTKKPA